MADAKVQNSESKGQSPLSKEILEEFQKLTDPKERKAFYEAHPELGQLYSPVNFHAA